MFCITRASGISDIPAPLAICCHDAGSANLVAAWVAAEPAHAYRICVEGPARQIFARAVPHLVPSSLDGVLDGARCLLSGTGWGSNLEHDCRAAAQRGGIPVFAVLDHWVNYGMRFTRRERQVLPDAFVVTDPEAARLAADTFGAARPVLMWHNRYLDEEVARVREISPRPPAVPPERLLVVLEPVREPWNTDTPQSSEFQALEYLMANLLALTLRPADLHVRLRLHPSEAPAKYAPWIERQACTRLDMSGAASLAEDLAWADAVAGLNSYALVVALAAGRRAISCLPPGAPACVLRAVGLQRLTDMVAADAMPTGRVGSEP